MKPGKGLKDKGKCEEGSSRGESRGLPGALETSWTLGDRKWSRQPRGWGGGRGPGSLQSQRLEAAKVSFSADTTCPRPASPRSSAHTPHIRSSSCLIPGAGEEQLPRTHLSRGQRESEEAETRSGLSSFCSVVASVTLLTCPGPGQTSGIGASTPRPPPPRAGTVTAMDSPPAPRVSECHSPGPARDEQ